MKAVNVAYNDFDETGKRGNGEMLPLKGAVRDKVKGYEEIEHIQLINPVDDTGKVPEVKGVVLMFANSKEKTLFMGRLKKFLK